MVIKTKKFNIEAGTYVWCGMLLLLRRQWWVWTTAIVCSTVLVVLGYRGWGLTVMGLLALYLVVVCAQFYMFTQVEENQLFFQKLWYELNSQGVVIRMSPVHGVPVSWSLVQHVWDRKDHFLLVLSMAQFIYLPHKSFHTPQEVALVRTLLRRKNLL